MAGIGFELKRMFNKKTIVSKFIGIFHSVFSTIGHMLFVVSLLIAVHIMMLNAGLDDYFKELYSGAVTYAFIFPFIFSSGLSIVMSRYMADNIYTERSDRILPSIYGSVALFTVIAAPVGIIFYILSPADGLFKLGAYMLYIETGVMFLMMTFITAIKKYKQASLSFFAGILVAGLLSYLIFSYTDGDSINKIRMLIFAFAIGMGIVICGVFLSVRKHFGLRSDNYFDFLVYIQKFPKLFFYNVFYTLGLYAHNFIFWLHPITGNGVAAYIYSGDYDMATFLGVLTILPATVLFIVRMETSFYDYYRAYTAAVNNATKGAIKKANADLRRNIWREFIMLIEIQAIVSLLIIVTGMGILPDLGVSPAVVEMFPFLACGFYFSFMMFITTTLLIYFENQTDALEISVIFLVSNIIFTIMTIFMGSDYYGLGLILSGAVSFIAAVEKLRKTVDNVDYIMFCSRALKEQNVMTKLRRIAAVLDGKKL